MSRAIHHIRPLQKSIASACLFVLLCCCTFSSHAQNPTANQIKAVFLYNFSKFITWPSNPPANTPFVIGILGANPFGNYLEQVVEDESVGNQQIVVQYYNSVTDIKACHILYINKSNAADIAKSLGERSILTVGEGDEFATSGGIVRFYFDNNKIRLRINQRHAKAANLQVSSKLLRIADVIE